MADPFELEIELKMAREELKHLPADDFNQRITLRDRILEIEAAIAAAGSAWPEASTPTSFTKPIAKSTR
jgi:hypothetical protein